MIKYDHHPQFVTITCLNWLPILNNDFHKQIVMEALKRRVMSEVVTIYAFVLMPNHMHFIWQLHDGIIRQDLQRDFLKFTARSILAFMKMQDDSLCKQLASSASDRRFQVWGRNALSIDLYTERVLIQKLNYVHSNPLQAKWKLVDVPEEYLYSSARFYETGVDDFGILTHYMG